jgi:hypothetical protein
LLFAHGVYGLILLAVVFIIAIYNILMGILIFLYFSLLIVCLDIKFRFLIMVKLDISSLLFIVFSLSSVQCV